MWEGRGGKNVFGSVFLGESGVSMRSSICLSQDCFLAFLFAGKLRILAFRRLLLQDNFQLSPILHWKDRRHLTPWLQGCG